MREISQIESMWHKFRHYKNVIPAPLLEMILEKGCRDLELGHFGRSTIKGSLTLTKPSKLKYLKLFFSKGKYILVSTLKKNLINNHLGKWVDNLWKEQDFILRYF